ncbi:hypothetical protein EVA_09476 [gut metagenome]|uniref:Uncharacterized protein n=1 Tax=gut metagenome TaxID=749906 RepID=J9GK11_9ZZZZ
MVGISVNPFINFCLFGFALLFKVSGATEDCDSSITFGGDINFKARAGKTHGALCDDNVA